MQERLLKYGLVLVVMIGWLAAAPQAVRAAEDEKDDTPPALEVYMGRRIAQTMHYLGAEWLTRASRDREEDTKTMLKALAVKSGQVVCDMGCGNGFYTLPMAKSVGEKGRVLAVDIQKEMIALCRKRAEAEKLENIDYIVGKLHDPLLPEGKLDLILCVDVYHEFSHPVHMLAAMRKSLKPDGRLVMVEFRAEDPNVPIKPEHKMSKKQVMKELTANGFKLVESFDKLPWQHMMFFQRDDGDKPEDKKE